jgi:hypothetical protein
MGEFLLGIAGDKKRRLSDAYRFEGFRPEPDKVRGMFGAPQARILPLKRRSKKHVAGDVAPREVAGMTAKQNSFAICRAEIRTYTWRLSFGGLTAANAAK